MFSVVSVTVKLGKQIVDRYLRLEKGLYNKSNYRKWCLDLFKNNSNLKISIDKDDTFYTKLGSKITDILKFSGLIDIKVSSINRTEKRLDFVIVDKKLIK